jgi:putative hemolysin
VGFEIQIPASASLQHRAALRVARPFLDWALALPIYRRLHQRAAHADGNTFTARALQTLDIDVVLERGDLSALPATGPLLVVSNHPHGMLDGLALAHLVHRRRSDVRVLTSHLLAHIEDLADLCLFVDPFGGKSAAARSRAGLRAARKWLDAGKALVVFPAGGVAHARAGSCDTALDSPWHSTAARLALATGAEIVPAFVRGGNSRWFYRAGHLHERLRTLLLGRELLNHRGRSVTVRLGQRISARPQTATADPHEVTTRFRRAVEMLGGQLGPADPSAFEPVASGPSGDALEAEVQSLERETLLVRSGRYDVYCARAHAMPLTLVELGRLRELSFRAVGEGTGKPLDLDAFDEHYLHLFVWNREAREIVGAYRLGLTDEIVAAKGLDGLYTSTLFRYDARLASRLSPAIELGRSFVRAEYQRSSNALVLLWKGIARFVARSRKYRVLFGPVSVSSRYGETSQQLLKAFLAQNFYDRELGEMVEALRPPTAAPIPRGVSPRAFDGIGELDRAIASLEADGKGVPVLLRQYLKLNAKLLGFNVDPDFGGALDALMMVDLAEVEPAILRRYFGPDAEQFVAGSRPAAA